MPTRVEVRDLRPGAGDDGIRQGTLAYARRRLLELGIPIADEAKTVVQLDILAIDVTWKDGTGRSCARLVGRTVREQQGYLAIDVPAEKCVTDHSGSNGVDAVGVLVNLATELISPARAPTAGAALYLSAVDPLLAQLAHQCRAVSDTP